MLVNKREVSAIDLLTIAKTKQHTDRTTVQNFGNMLVIFENGVYVKSKSLKDIVKDVILQAIELQIPKEIIVEYLRQVWQKLGHHESYLRKILPYELKTVSHINARYLLSEKDQRKLKIQNSDKRWRKRHCDQCDKELKIYTPIGEIDGLLICENCWKIRPFNFETF